MASFIVAAEKGPHPNGEATYRDVCIDRLALRCGLPDHRIQPSSPKTKHPMMIPSVLRLFAGMTLFAGLGASATAATTLFGQTFYSTNTATSESGGALVWNTLAGANSEMHTNFAPVILGIGETFSLNFNLRFLEPQGDGGASTTD